MYLGTLSFADGHGVFCIYRLVDDQYLGVLQGRQQPMGMQMKFFRGTRPAPNTLFFSNSLFKERKIMKPGQTITLNVRFNDKRLLDSADGYIAYEDGTKVGMNLSGSRTPSLSGYIGDEKSIAMQQQDLLRQLEEMKRQEAHANLVLAQQRENEGLVVMPLDQTTYKWVGNRLVKQYPSAIDGLLGDCQLIDAFKAAWAETWGSLFTKKPAVAQPPAEKPTVQPPTPPAEPSVIVVSSPSTPSYEVSPYPTYSTPVQVAPGVSPTAQPRTVITQRQIAPPVGVKPFAVSTTPASGSSPATKITTGKPSPVTASTYFCDMHKISFPNEEMYKNHMNDPSLHPPMTIRGLLGALIGIGQAPVVRDPWGQPTRNLPISVRYETEFEDELERIRRQSAPGAKEFIRPGSMYGLMDFDAVSPTVNVYRLDNFVTGRYNVPSYGIAWADKFGTIHLALGKKHPHLAVEEYQRLVKSGRAKRAVDDFNERQFGFDNKMFMYSAPV